MSTCKLCKNALNTVEEEVRGDICFKCIPNGIQIMWSKYIYDSNLDKWKWVIRTKELVRRRVTDSLFKNFRPEVKDIYRFKKYVSK